MGVNWGGGGVVLIARAYCSFIAPLTVNMLWRGEERKGDFRKRRDKPQAPQKGRGQQAVK